MTVPPVTRSMCGAPTKAGPPCRAALNLSSVNGRCLQHDADRAAERAAMHSAGGASRKGKPRTPKGDDGVQSSGVLPAPLTLAEVVPYLASIANALNAGTLGDDVAHKMILGARETRMTLEKIVLAEKQAELGRRLKALEEKKAQGRGPGPRLTVTSA